MRTRFIKKLTRLESRIQNALGKGYGATTCSREVASIIKLIPDPGVVLDIGTHHAEWTVEILKRAPAAHVWGFEPASVNIGFLRDRLGAEPRFTLIEAGLSDHDGTLPFYADAPGSGLGSIHKRDLSLYGMRHDYVEDVEVISWRTFRERYTSDPIDILKLDIEGHEFQVLSSIPDEDRNATKLIQFEFGGCNLDTRTTFRDFWNLLADSFVFYRISPLGLIPVRSYSERDEFYSTTNYLCLNKACARSA